MEPIYADKDELNFPPAKTVVQVLGKIDFELINRYQKQPEIIPILAKKHRVSEDRIFIESGTIGTIHRVFDGIITKKSKVLLPQFGYPYYAKVALHHKAKIVFYKFKKTSNSFEYDFNDLPKKLKESPDITVIIDPESPLGFSITGEKLQQILNIASKNKLVFLDQTQDGIRTRNIKDVTKLSNMFPNLIVARSFSKFYGLAGIRIGYAVCGKKVKKMINFQEHYLGFDRLAQKLAIAAMKAEKHYMKNAKLARKQKERLQKFVAKFPGYKALKTDTFYSIFVVPNNHAGKLKRVFEKNKILVRWLEENYPALKNFLRITATPAEQTTRIIKVFQKVQKEVQT